MIKKIQKLKKLGMTSRQAMLFVRSVAAIWYARGCYESSQEVYDPVYSADPFDTQFSKSLTPKVKVKKLKATSKPELE